MRRPGLKAFALAAALLLAALPLAGRLCELKCASLPPTPADHCAEHRTEADPASPDPCITPHGQNPALLSARSLLPPLEIAAIAPARAMDLETLPRPFPARSEESSLLLLSPLLRPPLRL